MRRIAITISVLALFCTSMTTALAQSVEWQEINVSASAYNSVPWQTTDNKPAVAAWGDVLKPGMRAIAVSRDLVKQGLTHGTKVRIEGLPGTYVVRDKMNRRWRNKIDILVEKKKKAREWGRQTVEIEYQAPAGSG